MSTEDEWFLGFNGLPLNTDEINGFTWTPEVEPSDFATALTQSQASVSLTYPLLANRVLHIRRERRELSAGVRRSVTT